MIKEFSKAIPSIDENAWIAESACVIGRVTLGAYSSIWYNSTIRGDINDISIGSTSNIQDNSVIHVSDKYPCIIGDFVTIGHGVILHACTVEDHCLIGMGAIIMDGCIIGCGSTIAAGAVLTKGTIVPPFSLFAGIPGKCLRKLDKDNKRITYALALKYKELFKQHNF